MLTSNEIAPLDYRNAMARFAGAVHVATTDGPAGRRGVTVIAACSVSDAPPTVLVCLNRTNAYNELFVENGVFALNTLTGDQRALADAFSGLTGRDGDERFALADWDVMATGAPALKGALAVFDCRVVEAKDMATHRVYFGKVAGLRLGVSSPPLLYHDRGYRVL